MSSANDRAVLDAIFGNLSPIDECPDLEATANIENGDMSAISDTINQLELDGVRAAESGDFLHSIDYFTRAIELSPNASAYNNRAQAHRLNSNVDAALSDLNDAIRLSNGRGRVAREALCQRGLIYRLKGRCEDSRTDFEAASLLGSSFAKSALVQLNPYAALCNQMLTEVFQRLQCGK
uniref:Tetratricopeptide repeat protein 36 homolog n=1 Tax=Strigamia maritima TaxID=126957 RepID=T1JJI5_STRMM